MKIKKLLRKRLGLEYITINFNINTHSIRFKTFVDQFVTELNIKNDLQITSIDDMKSTILKPITTEQNVDYHPQKTYVSDNYVYSVMNNEFIIVLGTKSSDKTEYGTRCELHYIAVYATKYTESILKISSMIDDLIEKNIENNRK